VVNDFTWQGSLQRPDQQRIADHPPAGFVRGCHVGNATVVEDRCELEFMDGILMGLTVLW
jgi:hypothetical protein